MRRIKVILAVALALAMMVTISVAPALAHNNDNDFRCCDNNVRFNHDFDDFDDFDCCDFDDFDDCCDFEHDNFFFNSFGFLDDCPFAGDFEGPVNQFDCFD
jgi:hypothetical protein